MCSQTCAPPHECLHYFLEGIHISLHTQIHVFTRSHFLMHMHEYTDRSIYVRYRHQCYRICVAACRLTCTSFKTAPFLTLASRVAVRARTFMHPPTHVNRHLHVHIHIRMCTLTTQQPQAYAGSSRMHTLTVCSPHLHTPVHALSCISKFTCMCTGIFTRRCRWPHSWVEIHRCAQACTHLQLGLHPA